jgi:hypothetical protein
MIRNSISLVGLLLSANFAGAAGTLGGAYDDARLSSTVAEASGMSVDYPAGLFTVDLGPSDKGPGRALRSEDDAAGFAFYVLPNMEHDAPASFLRSRLSAPRTKISYVRVTERFVPEELPSSRSPFQPLVPDPLEIQSVPRPSYAASSQDHSPLHQMERISRVRNRMRESRSSGFCGGRGW